MLRYIPQSSKKQVFEQVHIQAHSSCIIHSIRKMEIAQVFIDGWINKLLYVCTMEYYSATKRNEEPILATKWMNLYNIMLNERNQTLKATYCMVLLYLHEIVWNMQIQRERAVWWMLGDEASREERETAYWVKAFTLTFFQGWGMPCGLQILVSQPKIESTEWKYGALTPGLPGISLKGFTMVWWKYSRTI